MGEVRSRGTERRPPFRIVVLARLIGALVLALAAMGYAYIRKRESDERVRGQQAALAQHERMAGHVRDSLLAARTDSIPVVQRNSGGAGVSAGIGSHGAAAGDARANGPADESRPGDREPAAGSSHPAAAAGQPSPAPRPVTVPMANLTIMLNPKGDVVVNGVSTSVKGQPTYVVPVPVGACRVQAGYPGGPVEDTVVNVRGDGSSAISFDFMRRLTVLAPGYAGARVVVDDVDWGAPPAARSVVPGPHTVDLRRGRCTTRGGARRLAVGARDTTVQLEMDCR